MTPFIRLHPADDVLNGKAGKPEVQQMVMRLLKLPGLPGKDAADALGLAITHAHVGAAAQRLALAAGVGAKTGGKAGSGYRDGRSR